MKKKYKILGSIALAGAFTTALGLGIASSSNQVEASPVAEETVELCSMQVLNANKIPAGDTLPNVEWSETDDSTGYACNFKWFFTKNIDKQKAVEALKDYAIFYDGKPVHTDSNYVVNFNNGWASVSAKMPNNTNKNISSKYVELDAIDGVEFACVTDSSCTRYAVVVAKNSVNKDFDLSKIPVSVLTYSFTPIYVPSFKIDYNDSLQEECETWSESYLQHGNGKYYKAICNTRILNDLTIDGYAGVTNNDEYKSDGTQDTTQHFPEEEAPDITNPDNPNNQDNKTVVEDKLTEVKDKAGNLVTSLKEKYEEFKLNNGTAAKVATGIISGVLGIGLIYVIYIIIRKILGCLKKH